MTSTPPPRGGGSRAWWAVAVVLLLVAWTYLAVGLGGNLHPLAGPVGPQLPPPAAVVEQGPVALQTARSTPLGLSIPAIGLLVPLSSLGLGPDGAVQVPSDFNEPGWYQPGPSPGQVGSAVILGHVDSYQGPAVFFELRSLVAGDRIDVSLADGVMTEFAVTTVVMYSKDQFPDSLVYGSHGYSALQLVTCGGTFDPQTGHYLSNIVVYTALVSATPAVP